MKKLLKIFLINIFFLLSIELGFQSPVWAFMPSVHKDITTEATSSIQLILEGQTFTFSERALQDINFANEHADDPAFQTQSSYHFDNEDFSNGSNRLINLKERVITKIISNNPPVGSARSDLGGALHTVQDFYAHSNWVELGNSDINLKLGRESFIGADKNAVTCPNDPGILGDTGLNQLTSGYFLFRQGLCGVPSGKCRHGVKLIGCPSGLNKDDSSRSGFSTAHTLAFKATEDFIDQILKDSRVVSNIRAVKVLMGRT
jgi:von Willebrand factor A domain-containing protein 7